MRLPYPVLPFFICSIKSEQSNVVNIHSPTTKITRVYMKKIQVSWTLFSTTHTHLCSHPSPKPPPLSYSRNRKKISTFCISEWLRVDNNNYKLKGLVLMLVVLAPSCWPIPPRTIHVWNRPSRMREPEQELHYHDLVKEVQCIPGVQLLAPLLHLCLGHLPM